MKDAPANLLPVTIPLTAANHQVAEAFYQQHGDPQKAKQVYLNALSVQAVHFYLACLDIQTSLEKSQSWNPILQVLTDTADLWIEGVGRLECRPLLSDSTVYCIPAPVMAERIGYVMVRLNPDLTEADLLGFVPQVETEQLHLEKLLSIDDLPRYLLTSSQSALTRLNDWLHTLTETSWKTLETLLEHWQGQPALSFRTPNLNSPELNVSAVGTKRGKLLALGDAPEAQVLWLMEITPTRTASEYQIKTELCPIGKEIYLPRSLHLSVLDEEGRTVLQAESVDSEGLEFQFSGERGEQFSIKLSLHDYTLIETFEI